MQPQHPYPQSIPQPVPQPAPRKKRRVFLWVFLALQVAFIAWLAGALASGTGATPGEVAQMCGNGQWQGLWKSYSDCAQHSGIVAAHDAGKGIAVVLIVVVWVVVDFLTGLTYFIYRLAKR